MNALTTTISNVPAHITSLFAQLSQINKEASEGISVGMYPLIKLNGTRFVLVKDGQETPVKSMELRVVVLRAKQGFEKRYYAGAYDPTSTEAKAPDCYSMNGQTPEPGCAKPQNSSCAGCAQNAFGTGKDANGNPGKGKACSDRKLLAVLYPNPDTKKLEIYGLSLPPASLKKFGAYVDTLTKNNVPLPAATTVIGFDDKTSFPVLTFEFGGLLGEAELAQIVPMIESDDVKAIIDASAPAVSPVPPAISASAPVTSGFGFEPEPAEKPKKEKPLKVVKAAEPEPVVEEPVIVESNDPADDDLAAMLGIKI